MIIKIGESEWHDLKRQFTLPKPKECAHKRLQYVDHGELLHCLDCEKQVTAIWALRMYFTHYQYEKERLEAEAERLKEERKSQIVHRAALKFQEMVRKRKFFPSCPHCFKAIELDTFFTGRKSKHHYKEEALPLVMRPNITIVGEEEE